MDGGSIQYLTLPIQYEYTMSIVVTLSGLVRVTQCCGAMAYYLCLPTTCTPYIEVDTAEYRVASCPSSLAIPLAIPTSL